MNLAMRSLRDEQFADAKESARWFGDKASGVVLGRLCWLDARSLGAVESLKPPRRSCALNARLPGGECWAESHRQYSEYAARLREDGESSETRHRVREPGAHSQDVDWPGKTHC